MIAIILGTRPEMTKLAPVVWELEKQGINFKLVHSGQHYDYNLSKIFFEELRLPKPDYYLGVGSDSDARQTAKIMTSFENILLKNPKLRMIVVEGDTNTVLGTGVVAKKQNRLLAHVESGARSFDRSMPEEINRIVVDHLGDLLFAPTLNLLENLQREGLAERAILSGNTQIETLNYALSKRKKPIFEIPASFALATLHRQANTTKERLVYFANLLKSFNKPVIFLAHPRTQKNITDFKLEKFFDDPNIILEKPVGYFEVVWLLKKCDFVITDSGGLQEEAAAIGKPVVIPRAETEWAELVEAGAVCLVDLNAASPRKAQRFLASFKPKRYVFKEKHASGIIVKHLVDVNSHEYLVSKLHRRGNT